jgi:hypothetical protein
VSPCSIPKCFSTTAAERVGSMVNTTVSAATNTHSHQRVPSLPSTRSNTRQLVSSACTCPAAALRPATASSKGASSACTSFNAPHRVPSATSSPPAASDLAIRCSGRPSTYFS